MATVVKSRLVVSHLNCTNKRYTHIEEDGGRERKNEKKQKMGKKCPCDENKKP